MEKVARNMPSRQGGQRRESLGKSTVGEIVTGKRLPTKGKLLTFLAVCQVAPADMAQWLAAWERASTADLSVPPGAVRVREARPRQLGVHAAIQVDGAAGELPTYVPRDLDVELSAALAVGADQGCFVLLVGGSSVGKTRTLYQAVLATVPDWWLVHPDRDDSDRLRALAAAPTPRTVIWLDELQRYLDAAGSLTAGTVRALLRAGTVLVGTMWPDEYTIRITPRQLGSEKDPHARDRELLDLARVLDVTEAFTAAEQGRAQQLAATDARIRAALDSADGGLTQVLAAGPELVRWWEQSPSHYGKAIITAALDARRLGVENPVTVEFLADAVPGYLTPTQRATAPGDWLQPALSYATTLLHGAASALSPDDASSMGNVAGYVVADYLLQHAEALRNLVVPPASFWTSAAEHLDQIGDRTRLGWSAHHRSLNRYAAVLFERAAALGNTSAMRGLASVLTQAGQPVEAGTWLRRAAEVTVVDPAALAREMEKGGLTAEAQELLLRAANAGEPAAAYELARRMESIGRREEGARLVQQAASLGYPAAVSKLAKYLFADGRVNDAAECIRMAIQAHPTMSGHFLEKLAEFYDLGGQSDAAQAVLREAAVSGDASSMRAFGKYLLRRGDLTTRESGLSWLRRAAEAGNPWAMSDLAEALRTDGSSEEADEWLARAAWFGDPNAIEELSSSQPPAEAAEWLKERAREGDVFATSKLAEVLDGPQAESWLRAAASEGNTAAIETLIWKLKSAGKLSEAEQWLRRATVMGLTTGVSDLAQLLEQESRDEEARQLRRYGVEPDGRTAQPWP